MKKASLKRAVRWCLKDNRWPKWLRGDNWDRAIFSWERIYEIFTESETFSSFLPTTQVFQVILNFQNMFFVKLRRVPETGYMKKGRVRFSALSDKWEEKVWAILMLVQIITAPETSILKLLWALLLVLVVLHCIVASHLEKLIFQNSITDQWTDLLRYFFWKIHWYFWAMRINWFNSYFLKK